MTITRAGRKFDDFVRPIGPASPSLVIAATQQEFDDALSNIKDGYSGTHEIEVRFSPFTINSPLPRPAQTGATLSIVGDRSSPLVANAAPTFALAGGAAAEYTAAAYGAHAGIGVGTHWLELDFSAFGAGLTTQALPCLASTSPDVRTVSGFAPSGFPSTVYPLTTTLTLSNAFSDPQNQGALNGDGLGNKFGGTRLVGLILESPNPLLSLDGVTAVGCAFNGVRARGGFLGGVATGQLVYQGFGPGLGAGELSDLHAASTSVIQLAGELRLGNLLTEVPIRLDSAKIDNLQESDLRPAAAPCFRYLSGSELVIGPNTIAVAGTATGFFNPLNTSSARATLSLDAGATINGAVSGTAVELQNGAIAMNVDDAMNGTLTAGTEVEIDGVAYAFADAAAGVISPDSGAFIRS